MKATIPEGTLRLAVDTGGTFTDLVVAGENGALGLHKAPTTPDDPVRGVLEVLDAAARAADLERAELLSRAELFIHGTTHPINAILTGATARTAFLTTEGHPDILVLREGGRAALFDFSRPYPEPYVPRELTWEVPERIGAGGVVCKPLDEDAVRDQLRELAAREVEAVAVCLLWSVVNPAHELRVGELIEQLLPGVPYTLSHRINPALREYRRASSTAIDASLKPLMGRYLSSLEERLQAAGFRGRALIVTSGGGVLDAAAVARAPIHAIASGPAMAPVAGRHYAQVDVGADTAIVADTGGTSYDVSLVRRGRIPYTRETWIGRPYLGHMTGFPSVDVKSIGAGGGSIAWVDAGGLLHVGPQSAGAVPGPVCYAQGGTRPTVTDASLVLGWLDPDYFLGGAIELDAAGAARAIESDVARPFGLGLHEAAAAVLELATEHMVDATEELTLAQGIDPRRAVFVGGGGAIGVNAVAIARRLGCPRVVIPYVAPVLSAAGALMSDLSAEYATTQPTSTAAFDFAAVEATLAELERRCREFAAGPGSSAVATEIELSAEARYPSQAWELDVPLRGLRVEDAADVEQLRSDFHRIHRELFAIDDPESPVEIVAWRARVRCRLRDVAAPRPPRLARAVGGTREAYFPGVGLVEATVHDFGSMEEGERIEGPAIVESPITTLVVDPGASASRSAAGSLVIVPPQAGDAHSATAPTTGEVAS